MDSATPSPTTSETPALLAVEAQLRAWLEAPCAAALTANPDAPRPVGRPATLPAMVLWTGLLVALVRGVASPTGVWRLICQHGLWRLPAIEVTDMAVYQRLVRTPVAALPALFAHVTTLLHARQEALTAATDPGDGATVSRPAPTQLPSRWPTTALAPWAPRILAADHTSLDPVFRKRKLFRNLPAGALALLPGALACLFDVRRQCWDQIAYTEGEQDPRKDLQPLLRGLPANTLLLFDLGYFAFWWFDELVDAGLHYVTRLRKKVTYTVQHVYYQGEASGGPPELTWTDQLVYLGIHQAHQAAHPVRLIEITHGKTRYTYVTSVLDPRELPAWQVVELYRRRWDIEQAFSLVKTQLGLQLLWSGHRTLLLHQVYATFIIAQVALGLRGEVAQRAGCDPREVSLPLLLRWLPQLAADRADPVGEFVRVGWKAGYLRPFRGGTWELPPLAPDAYQALPEPIPKRKGRYPSRKAYYRRKAERQAARRRNPHPPSNHRPYGRKNTE